MAYTLEQLRAGIRKALKADPGPLLDREFVARHPTAEPSRLRKVPYGDPELGFCAPTAAEPARTYVMKPGDSHFHDVGVVHSPKREGLTKLVRIEGANLDRIQRSNIKAA